MWDCSCLQRHGKRSLLGSWLELPTTYSWSDTTRKTHWIRSTRIEFSQTPFTNFKKIQLLYNIYIYIYILHPGWIKKNTTCISVPSNKYYISTHPWLHTRCYQQKTTNPNFPRGLSSHFSSIGLEDVSFRRLFKAFSWLDDLMSSAHPWEGNHISQERMVKFS